MQSPYSQDLDPARYLNERIELIYGCLIVGYQVEADSLVGRIVESVAFG